MGPAIRRACWAGPLGAIAVGLLMGPAWGFGTLGVAFVVGIMRDLLYPCEPGRLKESSEDTAEGTQGARSTLKSGSGSSRDASPGPIDLPRPGARPAAHPERQGQPPPDQSESGGPQRTPPRPRRDWPFGDINP